MKSVTNGKLHGIIPPVITPLTKEEKLDTRGLKNLIEHCISGGVSGVFMLGSTGEAMRVSHEVWRDTIKDSMEYARGRIPVLCGAVAASTEQAIEKVKEAEQLGAEYVVVTAPFYIRTSCQDELMHHYEKVTSAARANVVVYNIPEMTGVCIAPETIARLAQIENVVAFKDSSADWMHFQRCLHVLEGADISIFNGAEELCAAAMAFGADGCVPGLACLFPEPFVEMWKAARSENTKRMYELQKKVCKARKSLFVGDSWLSAMKYLGWYLKLTETDTASFPIEPLNNGQKEAINEIVCDSGIN